MMGDKIETINQEIKNAHLRLSKTSARFLEFLGKNPGTLKRSNYDNILKIEKETGKLQPWPTFINQSTANQMKEASIKVLKLIKSIPQRLFSNDISKISSYYGFTGERTQLQLESLRNGHLDNLLARGDFVISPSGFKCLEYNVSAGIGGHQVITREPIYLSTPIIAKFLQEYKIKITHINLFEILFQHILKTALPQFSNHNPPEINIAIVLPQYKKGTQRDVKNYLNDTYQRVLDANYNHPQGKIIFCDFPHLTVKNDCIFYGDKRIHVLVEWYHGDIPFEILAASLLGNVILYNGPITPLLSSKLNQALLSENQDSDLFTPTEREIIKNHIPWTRRIVPGEVTFNTGRFKMEDLLISHQEKLVIKPIFGAAGIGITIGPYTPQNQWKEVVKIALRERNAVAQEYIESLPYLYQSGDFGCTECDVVWGLYVFGSDYAGGFLRLMPKKENTRGVINTHQGAERTIMVEVDQ